MDTTTTVDTTTTMDTTNMDIVTTKDTSSSSGPRLNHQYKKRTCKTKSIYPVLWFS